MKNIGGKASRQGLYGLEADHVAMILFLSPIKNFSEKLQKFSFLKESGTWNSLFF